jgi:hypothetical protein
MLAVVAALAMPQAVVVLLGQAALVAVETELLVTTLAMLAAPQAQLIEAVAVVVANMQTIQTSPHGLAVPALLFSS